MKPVTVIGPLAIVGRSSPSLHVFPVARGGAADLFLGVQVVDLGQLFIRVAARFARAHFLVLGALFARVVALGAEAPAVGIGHLVAVLVEEVDVVDLLHGAAGKARVVLHQVLQIGLGRDHVVAADRLVPVPVGARPHRVHAGEAADIAGDDAAGGEEEARQRDEAAIARLGRIVGVAPQRIVVADAVRVVADVVARGLVAPRFGGGADLLADALAQARPGPAG